MKTPGLRPTAWEPRTRLIAAALALVVVVGLALWWVVGADARRTGAACELFSEQEGALRTVLVETDEAAERAAAAGADDVIGSFDSIDSELNSLRRWQSTVPRVEEALGDDTDGEVAVGLASLTEGVAETQRLIEDEDPATVAAGVPELEARLDAAADLCATT